MLLVIGFVTALMFGFLFAPEWSFRRYDNGHVDWYGLIANYKDSDYQTAVCHSDTSKLHCGYFKASQVSGVLYVILGLWTTILYTPKIFKHIALKKYRIYCTCQPKYEVRPPERQLRCPNRPSTEIDSYGSLTCS